MLDELSKSAPQASVILLFIGLATTSIVAVIVRALQEWQVRREWPMLTFLGMNIGQFIVFVIMLRSEATIESVSVAQFLAWLGIYIFFTASVLGYLWQVIEVQSLKWRIRKFMAEEPASASVEKAIEKP